jgi:lysozyme
VSRRIVDSALLSPRLADRPASYDAVRDGSLDLSDDQINSLFFDDVDDAIQAAQDAVANFNDLPGAKQTVLVDMVFNLGAASLHTFKRFIAAVEGRNWEEAAQQLEGSRWYTQVGRRARQAAETMRHPD